MNRFVHFSWKVVVVGSMLMPTAFAQAGSCTQYGIIQAVGHLPQQTTLQVIVLGQMGVRMTLVLPAPSISPYKPGQRICINPPPTK